MYIYNKDNTTFADLIVPDFFHVGIELYYVELWLSFFVLLGFSASEDPKQFSYKIWVI